MRPTLHERLNRLELLTLRERVMLLAGVPVLLFVLGDLLVFDPAAKRMAASQRMTGLQQAEMQALSATLAARPSVAPQPDAEQLRRERDDLQARVDAARARSEASTRPVDWGTVVRRSVTGTPGLVLTQLRTLPAEVLQGPAPSQPASGPRPTQGAPAGTGDALYRHRAELAVQGDVAALLSCLQALQGLPGDLRWDRLQLAMAGYPQATLQLTLHTLSTRPDTPFN